MLFSTLVRNLQPLNAASNKQVPKRLVKTSVATNTQVFSLSNLDSVMILTVLDKKSASILNNLKQHQIQMCWT